MNKRYKVILNFYSFEQDGRKTPVAVGYRPHFVPYKFIPSSKTMCGVQFVSLPSPINMSQQIKAEVEFIYEKMGVDYAQLLKGNKEFQIYEGPKVIGEGRFI